MGFAYPKTENRCLSSVAGWVVIDCRTRKYEEDFEITTYTHEPPGARLFWGLLKGGIRDRAPSSLSQRWEVKSQLLSQQKQAHIPFDNTLARKIDGIDIRVTRLVEGHPENGEDLSRVSRGQDIKFDPIRQSTIQGPRVPNSPTSQVLKRRPTGRSKREEGTRLD